jgi:YVTN family beta-propeller protein
VQAFLQSSLSQRADVDLNKYYILALNQEPNISVIDPLLGLGATKLLTLVMLKSPGTDWVMSGDQRRLFVSMPLVNQVAVVDTETWKVAANVDAGKRPARLRLQRDGKYLWVGEGEGGAGDVTVIDAETLKVAARIPSGAGPHDIVLDEYDRHAFISNRRDGTLSVVATSRLEKVKEIKTGDSPVAISFSALSGAAYVAHESSGEVVVVDAARHEIVSRITTSPGLVGLRLTPDGRYGFAVNHKDSAVHIFDAATSRLLHTLPVGASPDQVSFTKRFAYVRSMGSEEVTTIRLAGIGGAGIEQAVGRFPGGQGAPHLARNTVLAPALINAPEEGAVLVANPADRIIYYYTEGMAAPMGNFLNYRRQPLALAVWDASLRETEPGVYRAKARLPGRGTYDAAFLLDSPRIVNCFQLTVAEDPGQERSVAVPVKVESLVKGPSLPVGTQVGIRFRVTDVATGRPKSGLADMGVLTFLSPGIWQQRDWARSVGKGVYEVAVTLPQEGVYYVFFQCPSLGVSYRQLPNLILSAKRIAPGAVVAPQKPHAAARP